MGTGESQAGCPIRFSSADELKSFLQGWQMSDGRGQTSEIRGRKSELRRSVFDVGCWVFATANPSFGGFAFAPSKTFVPLVSFCFPLSSSRVRRPAFYAVSFSAFQLFSFQSWFSQLGIAATSIGGKTALTTIQHLESRIHFPSPYRVSDL